MKNPAIMMGPDRQDLALTPHALGQDNLATGARRTTSPNRDLGTLGVMVLFQPDPAAQGTEGRLGIAPGHANPRGHPNGQFRVRWAWDTGNCALQG